MSLIFMGGSKLALIIGNGLIIANIHLCCLHRRWNQPPSSSLFFQAFDIFSQAFLHTCKPQSERRRTSAREERGARIWHYFHCETCACLASVSLGKRERENYQPSRDDLRRGVQRSKVESVARSSYKPTVSCFSPSSLGLQPRTL